MSRKKRLLIIGLGNHGLGWAEQLLYGMAGEVEVAGVVDQEEHRLSLLPEGISKYTDLETAVLEVQPEAAVNVTALDMHLSINKYLIDHGIGVICEKPIAGTGAGARELLEYCLARDAACMIAENYRYREVFRAARARIQAGEIGSIRRLRCNFSHYHPDYSGFYHGQLKHPLLLDVAIHHLDLARYLSGQEAQTVWCKEWPGNHSWYGSRPSTAILYSELTGGILFEYTGTLASRISSTDWFGDWEVEGDQATLLISGTCIRIRSREEETREIVCEDTVGDTRILVMREFLTACREERMTETDIRDNYKCFAWLQAAITSAEQGKEVTLNVD